MSNELEGKVAIVTGGASGLGRATCELFVEEGAKVVIADVNVEEGEALAATLGEAATFRLTDVSDPDEIQGVVDLAVSHFGGLDVMFNNAGIPSQFSRLLDNDFSDFDRVMSVDLFGVVIGSQRAARYMATHGGGSIINTSSIAALSGGVGPIVYRMAKVAINHFSRCIAIDLGEYGIRVNAIAPGMIHTPITSYDIDTARRLSQPLNRTGLPRDIANAALYLASDRSAQVTGIVITVDGGVTAGPPVSQMSALLRSTQEEG